MHPCVNTWIAIGWVAVGALAATVMLEIRARPKERTNARFLVRAHRFFGYLFVSVFAFMLVVMIQKLGSYQDELSPRVLLHAVLAVSLVPLLVLKIAIVRRYRALYSSLVAVGLVIPMLSFVLTVLTAGPCFLRQDVRPAGQAIQVREVDAGALLHERCTQCHSLARVDRAVKTQTEWSATIEMMIENSGDPQFLNPDEKQALVEYLSGRK